MDRINISNPPEIDTAKAPQRVEAGERRVETPSVATQAVRDSVALSDRSAQVERLTAQIADLPEIRDDRVQDLRGRIASGTYTVSSRDIADAIIAEERKLPGF